MWIKKAISIVMIFILGLSMPVMADEYKGVIIIDPGHGGMDGGATTKNGTVEKDINLAIGLKLRDRLQKEGYKVVMTREEDKELGKKKVDDLSKRCKLKKEEKCDAFISIHQNKFSQESCYGSQVWYANNSKSEKIANYIQDSLKEKVDESNKRLAKPAKQQYKILRDGYDGACVIVECGFISNNEEEKKLKSDEHQNKIVEGITCGINKYFDENK